MKIGDISPVLYSVSNFKYAKKGREGIRFDSEKTHYVYRFLCFTKGRLDAYIGDSRHPCCAGDILYLTPGEKYRLAPRDEDFSFFNVFFDFAEYKGENRGDKNATCIFTPYYDPSLCSEAIFFEDTQIFNESRIFKDADCRRIFETVLTADRTDPLYDFYAKTALSSAVSQILQSERQRKQKADGVDSILTYISLNPEKDLSATALSALFSYHKNHINHLVKSSTGLTLTEYVRRVKITHAKALLSESELPPIEVAGTLGYYDYSHFYKAFKDETGKTPTAYTKRK